jgi:hypothetical protein
MQNGHFLSIGKCCLLNSLLLFSRLFNLLGARLCITLLCPIFLLTRMTQALYRPVIQANVGQG